MSSSYLSCIFFPKHFCHVSGLIILSDKTFRKVSIPVILFSRFDVLCVYTEIQWSLLCKNHCIGESGGAFGCVPSVDILIGARLRELSDEMRWIDRNDEIDGIEKIDQIELISRRGSQHSFEHQLVKRPVKRQICQKLVKSWFDPAVQTAKIQIFVLGTQVKEEQKNWV